jgi:hypothetical protein
MKRRELSRFARAALLASVGRSMWLLLVVVLGAAGVEILASLIYDCAVAGQRLTWVRLGRTLAVLVVLAVLAYIFFLLDRRRARQPSLGSEVKTATIDPHPALIWLLSPDKAEPLLTVMGHHAATTAPAEDRLRHCWVLLTDHPAVERTYADLSEELERRELGEVTLHPVHLTNPDVKQTYRAVNRVYEDQLEALGLSPSQVVTDFTGGFKTMSAGALLACLFQDRPVEYLQSERGPGGEPIPGSERPVEVDVKFFVERRKGQ